MTDTEVPTDLKERVAAYEAENKALLAKYRLKYGINIDFPMYKELPDELKLALAVMAKHKMDVQASYSDIPEEPLKEVPHENL